ncbi:MAG: hypothetical protein AAB906_00340 [Patescibacteria group bacterium]
MWNEHNYNAEELKIVRELEYLLFMYNPGFRAMWHDNFDEYFKGTQNHDYWEKQEEIRNQELEASVSRRMIEDPEYASWRNEMAVMEETLFGDPNESYIARSRWFERKQMLAEMEEYDAQENWHNDKLFQAANEWGMNLIKIADTEYEKSENLEWFRILQNCTMVAGKIVFASGDREGEIYNDPEMFSWRTDRIGYILALASLQRCLESLRRIQDSKFMDVKINKFIPPALKMQLELADRLDGIEQRYLKSRI